MGTRRRYLLPVLCAILLAASCSNPYEQLSLVLETDKDQLQGGISFDMMLEQGYSYSTAVVCRIDAGMLLKENVELAFEVISPNHESFKETVIFPLVQNERQRAALGSDTAQIQYKRHGGWLDNQWGWRSGITCDTLPGRWRVIISSKNDMDLKRIRAIGFSYKGIADEQE